MTETAPRPLPTRRSRHDVLREVRVRPSRWGYVALAGVVVVLPGRRETVSWSWDVLQHGGATRQAFALYALWTVSLTWMALAAARHATVLRVHADGSTVLEQRGVWRRRTTDLSAGHRLTVVRLKQKNQHLAVLTDSDGRFLARLTPREGFWRRADVLALLRSVGVEVRYDTRRPDSHEIASLYPGASAWWHRHPVLFVVAVLPATLLLVAVLIVLFTF